MKAITIADTPEPLQLVDLPTPKIEGDECLIRLKASALNRRDQWIREGMYPGIQFGTVLGSDGCGEVLQGPKEWLGKEVIINPNVGWGDDPEVQASDYSVLGMPSHGTLSEYIGVPLDRIHLKPVHLSSEQAAALPLAGLTAFRATIKKGRASEGQNILVTGAGGGVSQMAIDFALAAGAMVYVTSGDETKIQKVKARGVREGFNYNKDGWTKQAAKVGGFDSIIDSAGGNQLNNYMKLIKPGGRIVLYGSTTGHPEKFDVFRLFWSQAQLVGSTMGSDEEFEEMMQWVNKHRIVPTVDKTYPFSEFIQAFNRFKEPDHLGKIVVTW